MFALETPPVQAHVPAGVEAHTCSCGSVRFVERLAWHTTPDGSLEIVTELACSLCGSRFGLLAC